MSAGASLLRGVLSDLGGVAANSSHRVGEGVLTEAAYDCAVERVAGKSCESRQAAFNFWSVVNQDLTARLIVCDDARHFRQKTAKLAAETLKIVPRNDDRPQNGRGRPGRLGRVACGGRRDVV